MRRFGFLPKIASWCETKNLWHENSGGRIHPTSLKTLHHDNTTVTCVKIIKLESLRDCTLNMLLVQSV